MFRGPAANRSRQKSERFRGCVTDKSMKDEEDKAGDGEVLKKGRGERQRRAIDSLKVFSSAC